MPTEASRRSYFDPLVLAKIANMSLRARHVVEGLLSGLHDSPYRGYSVEFAEHREYTPGDEIRHIDWKAYGKFDRTSSKSTKRKRTSGLTCWWMRAPLWTMALRG
jgi:uncharacterized protein (DUF58 family)